MNWQSYFNIAGLVLDLVAFTLIALEWRRTFLLDTERRQDELQDAYERNRAREQKKKVSSQRAREEELMAKEFSKLAGRETGRRYTLFKWGAVCFLIGIILQIIGSWPIAAA